MMRASAVTTACGWVAFGGALAIAGALFSPGRVGRAAARAAPRIVIAPPCDTRVNAGDAAGQLRARIAAGVADTECDLRQLDHLAGFVDDWADESDRAEVLATMVTECEWGWWDTSECRRYQEASRLDLALAALYDCADNESAG